MVLFQVIIIVVFVIVAFPFLSPIIYVNHFTDGNNYLERLIYSKQKEAKHIYTRMHYHDIETEVNVVFFDDSLCIVMPNGEYVVIPYTNIVLCNYNSVNNIGCTNVSFIDESNAKDNVEIDGMDFHYLIASKINI